MFKLGKELEASAALQPPEQSSGDSTVNTTQTSETIQTESKQIQPTPQNQLKQLDDLKARLLGLYQTRGFQVLSNHLKHLQLVKKEDQVQDKNSMAIEELNLILNKLQAK